MTAQALILDDSPLLAAQLARQLEACGLRARTLTSPEELYELAGTAALVCIELQLFGANGFQVARSLAARCSCPLLLLTGTGRGTDLQWGLRAGARAVLARPLAASTLHATLQKLGCCTEVLAC